MRILSFLFFILITFAGFALNVDHVEPTCWWTGMKNPSVQLMVHGEGIAMSEISLSYPGVTIKSVSRQDNSNYVFINLTIAPEAKAGTFPILFRKNKKEATSFNFELLQRSVGSASRKGFDASDVIYLITPDRFANGNPANDAVKK